MSDEDGSGSLNEAGESIFPLLMGFLLFCLWTIEDFQLFDKLMMTSLVLGLELMLVLGLNQPSRKMESPNVS